MVFAEIKETKLQRSIHELRGLSGAFGALANHLEDRAATDLHALAMDRLRQILTILEEVSASEDGARGRD